MKLLARFLFVLAAAVIPAAAAAAPTFAIRAGGVFEGPQHTLKNGFTAGGSVEWPRNFGALGIAVEWAGETGNDEFDAHSSVFHAGAFGRLEIGGGGVKPFLEAGVGVSHLSVNGGTGTLGGAESNSDLGGWVGAGVSMPVSRSMVTRLDGRYSMLAAATPNPVYDGGDLGDYFSVALSLAFVR